MRAVAASANFKDGAKVRGVLVLYREGPGHPEKISAFIAEDGVPYDRSDYDSCVCEPECGCFELRG